VTLAIGTIEELTEAIRGSGPVLPVAGASKPALSSSPGEDTQVLDISALRGVVDYDPAELTFTARAATPVSEIEAMLAEHGQYLPFDPPLAAAGATLGGAVAAGASGANAFRHGGIRDFVIGVQFVDGTGSCVSGGGRVVKNAAGFDLPKLLVGSMGRLGVIVSLSFKVFPRPPGTITLVFPLPSLTEALRAMTTVARGPLEAEALDIDAHGRLLVRLGGRLAELDPRARRCVSIVGAPAERLDGGPEAELWRDAARFAWRGEGTGLARVALTARHAPALHDAMSRAGAQTRFSLAGNVAWVAWPQSRSRVDLDGVLRKLGLGGMWLLGTPGRPLLGAQQGGAFAARLQRALDPDQRFAEVA
jgi:glycolate oxidase FAD binding subunit